MPANNTQFNLTIKVNGKEVKNTLNGVGKELRGLRARTNNLTEGTEDWKKASLELAKTEHVYKKMKDNQRELLEETKKNIEAQEDQIDTLGDFGEQLSGAFGALLSGDMMAFRDHWGAITGGIKAATKAAWSFIATPIGAAIAGLVAIGLAVKALWDFNVGLEKMNDELRALGVNASEMEKVRSGIQATAETFDKEFSEIAKKAKSLSTTYGISMAEANDIIARGLADGGKMNDEFLDSLGEYDVFFKEAGYSAQQFVDIINTGYELGIYSDKLPDAIKEAGLSLKEQTVATRDALVNAFGATFADDILSKIDKGQMTVSEGLEKIAAQAEKTGLTQQQQAQLTADIFRGAGEDAGGAMKILEAISQSANRELTAVAKSEMQLLEANKQLNEAQAELFEIGGLSEVWNNVKSSALSAFADILHGFTRIFASVEDLKRAAQTEGQNEAVRDMIANAKEFGTTAAEEAEIQMISSAKNIKRIKDEISNLSWYQDDDALKESLAKYEAYYAELEKIASGESAGVNKAGEEDSPTGDDDKDTPDPKANAAAEAKAAKIKASEQLVTDFLEKQQRARELSQMTANEKELSLIDEKYAAMIEKAGKNEDLVKELELARQQEKDEALAKKQEEQLERLAEFEARKQEFLNELELQKAETDEEKEELKQEQELEKEEDAYEKKVEDFEAEMEWLQMTEEEKAAMLESLKENHEENLTEIKKKYTDKKIADEERLAATKKKLWNDSLSAAINLAGRESKIGKMLLIAKQIMAAKEMAIQLGLFKGKVTLASGESLVNIAKGTSETAAAAPFPANIPLLIGFAAQVIGIIAAISSAANAGSGVQTSFAKGGFTDLFGTGHRDETGHEVAGVVHTGEYVIPNIVRKLPEMPYILNYLETKRKQKLGLYASGGEVSTTKASGSSGQLFLGDGPRDLLLAALEKLMLRLDAPLQSEIFFGPEAELKRQEQQKRIDKIKRTATVKKR